LTINNTTIANSIDVAANARASSIPFVDQFEPRDPTTSDIQYPIQKKWLNTATGAFWELQNFMSFNGITTANWVLIGHHAAVTETLTGNDGIVVPPTGNNINVVGDVTNILTTGNAGTSTLTIHLNGNVATSYVEDVGTAVPAGGILNVLGSTGITTTGSGNTITIETNGTIATSYPTDSGTAIPSAGVLNVFGDGKVTTSGSGNTIDLHLSASFYSTGSWSPNLAFGGASVGITYGVRYGEYTVIGNLVFYTAYIELTSKGSSSGTAIITNLPFTAINAAHVASGTLGTTAITFPAGSSAPYVSVTPNTTDLQLLISGSTLGATSLNDTNFANTTHLDISGFYFTS